MQCNPNKARIIATVERSAYRSEHTVFHGHSLPEHESCLLAIGYAAQLLTPADAPDHAHGGLFDHFSSSFWTALACARTSLRISRLASVRDRRIADVRPHRYQPPGCGRWGAARSTPSSMPAESPVRRYGRAPRHRGPGRGCGRDRKTRDHGEFGAAPVRRGCFCAASWGSVGGAGDRHRNSLGVHPYTTTQQENCSNAVACAGDPTRPDQRPSREPT